MRKTLINLIVISTLLSITPSALARTPLGREIKNEVKESIREDREGLVDKIKNLVKTTLRFDARIKGDISAKTDSSLTVTSEDGAIYTVNVSDKTQLLLKFGGKSSLSEYSVGDEVMVFGKFTDDSKTTIDAKVIRDLSIQKRWGAFIGNITAKSTNSFVINTVARGNLTVFIGSATKFINRKEEPITYADIQLNHRVMVKGVWDKTLDQITVVEKIKDFSLPVIVTPTETETE